MTWKLMLMFIAILVCSTICKLFVISNYYDSATTYMLFFLSLLVSINKDLYNHCRFLR